MNYAEIREINLFIHSRFYYTSDDPKHDDWKSSAKQLLADPTFKIYDDCDGLASTTAHYLNIKGAQKVWRILASMDGGPKIDHMVAMVEADTGQRWVVGDTGNNLPCRLQDYDGRMFMFNNITDGVNWRPHP
jgi:hypothetical protein